MTSIVPRPGEVVDPVVLFDRCDTIDAWAAETSDVNALHAAAAGLAAIDEYLARTSTEGRERVAASMVRLQARIGALLGPTSPGRRHDLEPSFANEGSSLTPNERRAFRKMAAHPDIVEAVIADSSDTNPPSRARILNAIRDHTPPAPRPEPTAYEHANAIFDILAAFNTACEQHDDNLAAIVRAGLANTDQALVGGLWMSIARDAIEHLASLRELKQLRSVK